MSVLSPFLTGEGGGDFYFFQSVQIGSASFPFSFPTRTPMSLSLEVERPAREADYQPLSSATLTTRAPLPQLATIVALSTNLIFREPAAFPGGAVAETNLHPLQGCKIYYLTLQSQREVYFAPQNNKRIVKRAAVTLQYYRDPNVINLRAT
jgi:hypothetical protein